MLTLVAAGMSNAAIALRLFVSESTVQTRINHSFAKIGVSSRGAAA